jgi:hypothetical protein
VAGGQIVALGAVAGGTIFLGLTVARSRGLSPSVQALLNSIAIGILLFLFWDILTHAVEPVEAALTKAHDGEAGRGRFACPTLHEYWARPRSAPTEPKPSANYRPSATRAPSNQRPETIAHHDRPCPGPTLKHAWSL